MNDNELEHHGARVGHRCSLATPIAQIISRGRAVRARRRASRTGRCGRRSGRCISSLAVTTLVPSGHPGNPLVNARLAAWTVAKQANGDIDVTINQLKNPVGLQSTLRADGVPVRVSYSSHSLPVTRSGSYRGHPVFFCWAYGGWACLPRPTPPGRPGAPAAMQVLPHQGGRSECGRQFPRRRHQPARRHRLPSHQTVRPAHRRWPGHVRRRKH